MSSQERFWMRMWCSLAARARARLLGMRATSRIASCRIAGSMGVLGIATSGCNGVGVAAPAAEGATLVSALPAVFSSAGTVVVSVTGANAGGSGVTSAEGSAPHAGANRRVEQSSQ